MKRFKGVGGKLQTPCCYRSQCSSGCPSLGARVTRVDLVQGCVIRSNTDSLDTESTLDTESNRLPEGGSA